MAEMITQIGPYSIDREIGRGGMGVVYLGTDTRLDRKVAVKALPAHFAEHPERLARFEREAKTLAQLSHPNVAGIYGVEEHEGARYLVLEYVEGETLAERLDRGALPVDEAIEFAVQIAAGVEAAHDAGVIHRDLKPANVKITPDGKVKVLDFGLARSEEVSSSGSSVSHMPTLTTPASPHSPTMPGAVLGTAPYMSPEQARGRSVDKRTDIWSFGVMLYEMLTGAGPFVGETATDSIGAILHKDVDLNRLPANTPANVRHVLRRCLQRNKDERFRDIGDVRLDLGTIEMSDDDLGEVVSSGSSVVSRALLLLAGVVIGGGIVWRVLPSEAPVTVAPAEPRRFSLTLPESAPIAPPSVYPFGIARPFFDVSPDGSTMIYTALIDGGMHLYLRDMATGEVNPVPGGQDGFGSVFSPGGNEIAFFANERLYRMDLDRRGTPQMLTGTSSPGGLDWASDGTLYFSAEEQTPLYAIPASGGESKAVTRMEGAASSHNWPRLTPDERTVLFTNLTDVVNICAIDADGDGAVRTVLDYASGGSITASGHFLFVRENRLMAVAVDPATIEFLGEPVTVLSNIRSSWFSEHYVVTGGGTLIYADGLSDETARFVFVHRDGEVERLDLGLRRFVAFALSPDGRYLATPIFEGRDSDIWVYDLERPQTPMRITFGGVHNAVIWSEDGRYLLFGKYASDGTSSFYAKDMQSGAPALKIYESDTDGAVLDYHTPSGELMFSSSSPGQGLNLMRGVVDLSQGEGATVDRVEPLRATRHGEPFAAISPDRKWIAAVSDETGRWEMYVSSYPDFGSRMQISSAGAEEPIWTDDGSRVIYRWNDEWFEVEVTTEPALAVSEPRVIAKGPYVNVPGYSWDMTGDGERLLLLEGPQQDTPVTELQVITNFLTELERIAPHPEGD